MAGLGKIHFDPESKKSILQMTTS